jgi:hypothetical protein
MDDVWRSLEDFEIGLSGVPGATAALDMLPGARNAKIQIQEG